MKLYIFNGSPRAEESNTAKILSYFVNGFLSLNGNEIENLFINDITINTCIEKIIEAENICIAFPLYILSMPANVKQLIERLPKDNLKKKIIVFIQSGFPESSQMRVMKEYFKLLFADLQYDFKGIIIKGFGAGIEMMPSSVNKNWTEKIYKIGLLYGQIGELDLKLLEEISRPEKLSKPALIFYKFLKITGVLDLYTSEALKRNGKTEIQSYAKPLFSNGNLNN